MYSCPVAAAEEQGVSRMLHASMCRVVTGLQVQSWTVEAGVLRGAVFLTPLD